jgi:hypothetical protein
LRTGSTVAGIAIATVIITSAMSSQGYEASLSLVSGGADRGIGQAFASGLRTVYLAMAGIQVLVAVLSLPRVQRGRTVESEAETLAGAGQRAFN